MPQTHIPSSTFTFLNQIKKNNNREWFNAHKAAFKKEADYVKDFFQCLLDEMNQHDQIEKLKVFRIYRDVRFSKDKSPYKTNFSGGFSRATAALRGGYYVHLEPGNSFVGGGFYGPEKHDLLRIRQEIAADDQPIRKLLKSKKVKAYFGGAFNAGDTLKTAPKGFDKDHPAIDLLRMKSFTFTRSFTNKEVHSKDFLVEVNTTLKALRPYFDYMSEVLTTDLNGRSLL
ncbi:MAG: DUF2461 domain-containing protein [Saprospiraceae bacterium]|nr:DUF2461 domain-containing protein [Saprospiraceae bacterium]